MTNTGNTTVQVNEAYEKLTGKKFCTTCQKIRKLCAGGVWKGTAPLRRWMCAVCVERLKTKTASR